MNIQKIFSTLKPVIGLTLICPIPAFAHLLAITPTAPFPSEVLTSSTTTAIYTVTNISKIPLTVVNQSELSKGISVSSSTCGLLAAGKSCDINMTLVAPATPTAVSSALKLWAKPSRDGVQFPIGVKVLQPTEPPSAIAAGQDLTVTGTQPPLLVISQNLINWNVQQTFTGSFPTTGAFFSTASTGTGSNAIYLAGGNGASGGNYEITGFLALSQNNGRSWTIPSIVTNTSRFNAVAATGIGSNAILTAAGPGEGRILVSQNGGSSWVNQSVQGIAASVIDYTGASCTGNESTAICATVGHTTPGISPVIAVSINGGSFWSSETIQGFSDSGILYSVSCTGSSPNARCVAAGTDESTEGPLLVSSINGSNWTSVIAPSSTANFLGVSCTGSGASAICVAAGHDTVNPGSLAVSQDGGTNWTTQTANVTGYYYTVSCTGNTCVAVGQNTSTKLPLIVTSTNGGTTWTVKPVNGTPPGSGGLGSFFRSVTCANNGSNVFCTAAGEDASVNPYAPLLAMSTDGGNTWAYQTVTNMPAQGILTATAETSALKKLKK